MPQPKELVGNDYASITDEGSGKYILHFHLMESDQNDRVILVAEEQIARVQEVIDTFMSMAAERSWASQASRAKALMIIDMSNVDQASTNAMYPLYRLKQYIEKGMQGKTVIAGANF